MESEARSTGASTEVSRNMPRRVFAIIGILGLVLVGLVAARAAWKRGPAPAFCGNGTVDVDAGEECDDGNQAGNDGCLPTCRLATCGDGIKRAVVEECDDGNRNDGDGCSSACLQCPDTATSFASTSNGHCYWREETLMPFDKAAAACRAQKANLVIFSSDTEWRAVTERLLSNSEEPGDWIGLREEDRGGVRDFGWISGDRLLSSHWGVHQPRRAGGACAAQAAAGTWMTVPCNQPRGFVCERPRWTRAPRDGRAFRRFIDKASWEGARAACAKEGARLVTFANMGDQEWISQRYPGPLWMGARRTRNGDFRWVSGERMQYRDFAPGEPKTPGSKECLALDIDGRWYARNCLDRNSFVCEAL